jgi:hypothetical protein
MTPAEMGRKGGQSRSAKKVAAAKKNGLIGALRKKIRKELLTWPSASV